MADFRRGIKAGVIVGIVYMIIAGILGAIYYDPLSVPHFIYGTGLTIFTWRSLRDFSSVYFLLSQYVYRGIVFGAVFAALYNLLPGTASVKKGVGLSAFLCIVALVGAIYTTPGWPADGWITGGAYYSGMLNLSSISLALVGIMSALAFGALTGLLWDRFRGTELMEEGKGNSVLLVSFILGLVIWVVSAVPFLLAVVINRDVPSIGPGSWWFEMLLVVVVFLGLPGWILTLVAWRKTRRGESGFKCCLAGGVLMALTGHMLLPGVLSIIGGVLSGRKSIIEPSSAATT